MLFGDAHIDELLARFLALLGKEPDARRYAEWITTTFGSALIFFIK